MNTDLLARALGRGAEIAANTPFPEWQRLLATSDSISDVVRGSDGQFATYDLMPVQELVDTDEIRIEIRILASDGENQLVAYFYAQSKPERAS